jgi:hypothetical protein
MKNLFIVTLILALGLMGCSNKAEREVVSIVIECSRSCKTTDFTKKTFEDDEEIKTFLNAVESAGKMSGILNYAAMYYMTYTFNDDSQQRFVLNVSDQEGSSGLLVDMAHSEQGYSIPEEQARKLAKMLHGS